MREILLQQVSQVKAKLIEQYPQFELNVVPAMTYGNPNIQAVLDQISAQPQDHIILFPLFPSIQRLLPHLCMMRSQNGC